MRGCSRLACVLVPRANVLGEQGVLSFVIIWRDDVPAVGAVTLVGLGIRACVHAGYNGQERVHASHCA